MNPSDPAMEQNNPVQVGTQQAPVAQPTQQPAAPAIEQTPAEQTQEIKPMEITITLPTNAYFISGIRDFTLNLIRNMTQFSEQWAFRFQSVVDELCNNAIEHGSAPGDIIKITFINNPNNSIEIVVQDSGKGKVKIDAAELTRIVKERTDPNYVHTGLRGRGLAKIVSEWTDELTFRDIEGGGIEAKIKKYLRDPNIPQPSANPLENPTHLVLNN